MYMSSLFWRTIEVNREMCRIVNGLDGDPCSLCVLAQEDGREETSRKGAKLAKKKPDGDSEASLSVTNGAQKASRIRSSFASWRLGKRKQIWNEWKAPQDAARNFPA